MAKKPTYGLTIYVKRNKRKIGRHKKRLNKSQTHKKSRGQGR